MRIYWDERAAVFEFRDAGAAEDLRAALPRQEKAIQILRVAQADMPETVDNILARLNPVGEHEIANRLVPQFSVTHFGPLLRMRNLYGAAAMINTPAVARIVAMMTSFPGMDSVRNTATAITAAK